MRFLGGLMLLAAAAAADPASSIDKATAEKLAALGQRALEEGQPATARRVLSRAIELDSNQPVARERMGFRRTGRRWTAAGPEPEGEDGDPKAAAAILREAAAEEERRADAYVGAELTAHYTKLLRRVPRNEAIHKALGHERIGDRYARPELAAAARAFDRQQARWKELAAPATVEEAGETEVPGVGLRPAFKVEDLLVAGHMPEGEVRDVARTIPSALEFQYEVFGNDIETWELPEVFLLPKEDYLRCIDALTEPGTLRDLWRRSGLATVGKRAVFFTRTTDYAIDCYAHAVAIHTAVQNTTPPVDDPAQRCPYAWYCEGMGYFASMALHGTALTWYFGSDGDKGRPKVAPPEPRNRATLLPWLQAELIAGNAKPLRQVLGAGLNALDLLQSLEAWSFLEFLAAHDPEGFKRLPGALREQGEGPYDARNDAALRKSFGKGIAELEPLWRAFVLEIM